MLRESSKEQGHPVDLAALKNSDAAEASGVPDASILSDWIDAAKSGDRAATTRARDRVIETMGVEAAIDSAAVLGNFERMTRIADAIGIPLDPPVNALTSKIQESLELRDFRTSSNTSTPGAISGALMRMFGPLLLKLLPSMAKRVDSKRASG